MACVPIVHCSLGAEANNGNTYHHYSSPLSLPTMCFQRRGTLISLITFPCCTNVLTFRKHTRTNFPYIASPSWMPRNIERGLDIDEKMNCKYDNDDDILVDDEEETDEEGETDEGEEMPSDKLRRWLRNKPAGFGEGKIYDISLEEKLLQEVNQSPNTAVSAPKKLEKHVEAPSNSVRVRLGNLPRKRNIHRDLQSAFKGFSGISNITPIVSGNRETRDPICRGFAYLDLKSEEAAERFVRTYSNQSIRFGKVEKYISCRIMNPSSSLAVSRRELSDKQVNDMPSGRENLLNVETTVEELHGKEGYEFKERKQTAGDLNLLSQETDKELLSERSNAMVSSPPEESMAQRRGDQASMPKSRRKEKKKQRKEKKYGMPSSSIRLKIRDRSALSSVFSKYGGAIAPGLEKQS